MLNFVLTNRLDSNLESWQPLKLIFNKYCFQFQDNLLIALLLYWVLMMHLNSWIKVFCDWQRQPGIQTWAWPWRRSLDGKVSCRCDDHFWWISDDIWWMSDDIWWMSDNIWWICNNVWWISDNIWWISDIFGESVMIFGELVIIFYASVIYWVNQYQ